MRVLLDESIPRRLASVFPPPFKTFTVQQMGWAGCSNGELLQRAIKHRFGVLITVDQGFAHQQNIQHLPIPVIIMTANRSRLQELLPLAQKVIVILEDSPERRVYHVAEG